MNLKTFDKTCPGWKRSKLGDIGELGSGSTPSRTMAHVFFSEEGILWVKTGDLNNGSIFQTEEKITEEALRRTSCKIYPEESVLIAMYGGFRQIGRTGILGMKASINQAITAIIVNKRKAIPHYVQMWLINYLFLWRRFAASSRKDPNITKDDIKAFPIILPSIREQEEIVRIIKSWGRTIDLIERLIAAKQDLRKGLMQQLLTGKRRFPGFTEPWERVQIGDVLKEIVRPIEMEDDELYELASVRRNWGGLFVRDKLHGHEIKTKNLHEIKMNDFLIAHIQVAYGSLALVPEKFDRFKVSNLYTCLVPRDLYTFDIRFFAYLAQRPRMTYLARISCNGFFAERLRLNFQLDAFLKQEIIIPPSIDEQRKIIACLEALGKEIRMLQERLEAVKEQKKGLMQQLLTGKVRVNVPETNAAD